MKQYLTIALLLTCLFITTSPFTTLKAQEATITRFHFECSHFYTIWEDGFSDRFTYWNEKKQEVIVRTVDTLFSYAQETIARKLNIQLEKKKVGKVKQIWNGRIEGFPNEKAKNTAQLGKYDRLIEVSAIAIHAPNAVITKKGAITKTRYKIDMIVEVKVFDKGGNEIEKYKKSARTEQEKEIEERGGEQTIDPLSGNELFVLFLNALNNALANKK